MNTRLALLIVLSSLTLAGCGNKGPLVQAPPKAAEEAPASDGTPPAHDESEPIDTDGSVPEQQDENTPPEVDPVIEPVPPGDGS